MSIVTTPIEDSTSDRLQKILGHLKDTELRCLAKLLEIKNARLMFALDHHVNTRGDRMDFEHYPHIRQLYESTSKTIVLQGSVQSFKSEWAIIDHFAAAYSGLSIFYVVPKFETRNTYVQNRVNRCVENVEEYKKIIGSGFFDSVALKNFGRGIIKYVGSNVISDFKEFPADMVIVDEVDECNSENISYAADRLRASPYQFYRYLGNPRYKGKGINALFLESDQREWYVPCKVCKHFIELDWFRTVVEEITDRSGEVVDYKLRDSEWQEGCGRDVKCVCPECNGELDRSSNEGKWVANNDSDTEGYHISMLCSLINSVSGMWDRFRKGITNPTLMQKFYNSDLGLPYDALGNKVNPSILENCVNSDIEFTIDALSNCGYISTTHRGPCSMGVDVGSSLDVRISYPDKGKRHAVYIGKVSYLEDLYDLIERYNVEVCVMDSMPEATLAKDFQDTAECDVWLCSYRSEGKDRKRTYNVNDRVISIDRTEALDRSFSQLKRGKNILPKNHAQLIGGEYVDEMCVSVRSIVENDRGDLKYEWSKGKDHQRHCDTYDFLATDLMIGRYIDDIAIG